MIKNHKLTCCYKQGILFPRGWPEGQNLPVHMFFVSRL
jgi:hypothetical protein